MVNHVHVILRNRPDVVAGWSDKEVAKRWWQLFPLRKNKDKTPAVPTESELKLFREASLGSNPVFGFRGD